MPLPPRAGRQGFRYEASDRSSLLAPGVPYIRARCTAGMEEGEERLRQEDCSEDRLGVGILTLTNRRLAFDKTKGRIMDFRKEFGETVVDMPLGSISRAWKEGLLMKKVCVSGTARGGDGSEETFKFGVLGSGSWLESIQDAIEDAKAGGGDSGAAGGDSGGP